MFKDNLRDYMAILQQQGEPLTFASEPAVYSVMQSEMRHEDDQRDFSAERQIGSVATASMLIDDRFCAHASLALLGEQAPVMNNKGSGEIWGYMDVDVHSREPGAYTHTTAANHFYLETYIATEAIQPVYWYMAPTMTQETIASLQKLGLVASDGSTGLGISNYDTEKVLPVMQRDQLGKLHAFIGACFTSGNKCEIPR